MTDQDDRIVCMCFHVPLRKLEQFHRRRSMKVSSQFSDCHGAGTGCGWCVPFLEKIFEQLERGERPRMEMAEAEYRWRRGEYRQRRKPELPPPADAEGPIAWDPDDLLKDIPDDLRLD